MVVVAFIVGMLLTPPDVFSQVMLAVPMWLLFELGLLASGLFVKRIDKVSEEREAAEQREREASMAASLVPVSVRSGANVESWENERYSFEETGPVQDDDEYRPMTEEEMEAELGRLEAEQAAVDEQGRYAAGNNSAGNSTDNDKGKGSPSD